MLKEIRNKILIVDDDPDRRELIRADLGETNYWIFEANRLHPTDTAWDTDDRAIPSVRKILNSHFFHAAIVDLSFDETDNADRTGFEIVKFIHNLHEGTKCVVLTGYGVTQDVRNAFKELQVHDYLDKDDYSAERIHELTEEAVKDSRLRLSTFKNKLTYYDMVKEPKLPRVVDKLQIGSEQEIRSVVESALLPYIPYDTRQKSISFEERTLRDTEQHIVLVIRLWSRYLGRTLALTIGSRRVCEDLAKLARYAKRREDIDFKLYEYSPRDKVIGLLECMDIEDPSELSGGVDHSEAL